MATASFTGTTGTVTGLTPGTSYTATVRALDAAGNGSAQSSSITFTTLAALTVDAGPDQSLSPFVTGIVGAVSNNSAATFAWSKVSGPAVTFDSATSSASRTFTVANVRVATPLVLQVQATVSGVTVTDTVTVTVLPTVYWAAVGGVEVPINLYKVVSSGSVLPLPGAPSINSSDEVT